MRLSTLDHRTHDPSAESTKIGSSTGFPSSRRVQLETPSTRTSSVLSNSMILSQKRPWKVWFPSELMAVCNRTRIGIMSFENP